MDDMCIFPTNTADSEKSPHYFTKEDTQLLKGLAILLMLYHHLFAFPNRIPKNVALISIVFPNGETSAYLIGSFGKICVALFIFLSGYGIYCSLCHHNQNDLRHYVFHRLKSIYFSFWKVFLIFIPLCMILNITPVKKSFLHFIANFLGIIITYNGEWWFLTPYVILVLFVPLIYKISNKLSFRSEFIVILCLLSSQFLIPKFIFQWFSQNIIRWNIWSLYTLGPIFLAGWFLAKYSPLSNFKKILLKSKHQYIYSISLFLLGILVKSLLSPISDLLCVILLAVSFPILLQANLSIAQISKKAFSLLGQHSTNIWLTHSFYCYMLIPNIIYAPRFTPFISCLLIVISVLTSYMLNTISLDRFKKYFTI